MKKLTDYEHKQIMLQMLNFITNICKENNIKYTLIGGSLIGAIREHNIIPWDDDIDISLLHDDYIKLISILKNIESDDYKLFDDSVDGYYYPYAKFVSKKTILFEKNLKPIDGYGVFIDIFEYNYTSNDLKKRKSHFNNIKFRQKFIGGYFNINPNMNFIKKIRKYFCEFIGINFILKFYRKGLRKYSNSKTNYLVSSWPVYKFDSEVMETKNFEEFMFVDFGGIDAMVSKNYHEILSQAFGDYMTPPPADKRVAHNLEIYWRD